MFELVYGNSYEHNSEITDIDNYDAEFMLSATLDFLETVEDNYRDDNNKLPNDWVDTIFWKCNKM